MAMSVAGMKQALLNAFNDPDNATDAQKTFGDALLKYLVDNMEIKWAYVGQNSQGVPAPVTSFSSSVSGSGLLGVPSDFDGWLPMLVSLIKELKINIPPDFIPLQDALVMFNPAAAITAIMSGTAETQDEAMQEFCTQLLASLTTSFINPAPVFMFYGNYVYTGNATMVGIV